MFCEECEKKPTCKKICTKLKNHLKSQGIYSADFIRPEISSAKRKEGKGKWREVPFSALSEKDQDKNPYLADFDTNI